MTVHRKLAAAALLTVGLTLPLAGVASAEHCAVTEDYCTPHTPEVDNTDTEILPQEVVAGPAQAEAQQAPSGSLPLTGGDVVGMTVIGAGAVAVGALLVKRSKRAGTPTAA